MPSWNIHLEAGDRLAKKLKISGNKRKEFLLGCLLPDINNGYINQVKVEKSHDQTHYAYNQKSSLNFYAKYHNEIDQRIPVYFGYLFHLYTDGYFNYNFYRAIKQSSFGKKTLDEKLKIKHHDFWLYDLNFNHKLDVKTFKEAEALVKVANQIDNVEIMPEEVLDVEKILTSGDLNKSLINSEYIFCTKEWLDQLLENMISSFSKDYLGEKDA